MPCATLGTLPHEPLLKSSPPSPRELYNGPGLTVTSESVDALTFLVGEYSRSLHGRDFLLFPGEVVPSSEERLLERGEFSWLLLLGVFLQISTLNSGSVLILRGGFSPGFVSEVAILTNRRKACFADCFSSYAFIFCNTIVFVYSGSEVSGFMVLLLIVA
jgi:hypothetical protein